MDAMPAIFCHMNKVFTSPIPDRRPDKKIDDRRRKRSGICARAAEVVARHNAGDFEGATALLPEAMAANPNDAQLYYVRGFNYAAKSDWNRAMDDFSRVIELSPGWGQAYSARAKIRIERRDFSPALLEDCNKAVALDTKNGNAYLRRGVYYAHQGALKMAEADWTRAIALDPTLETAVQDNRAFYHSPGKKSARSNR